MHELCMISSYCDIKFLVLIQTKYYMVLTCRQVQMEAPEDGMNWWKVHVFVQPGFLMEYLVRYKQVQMARHAHFWEQIMFCCQIEIFKHNFAHSVRNVSPKQATDGG